MSEMKNLSDLDISILSMEGDRTRKPLLEEDFIVAMPQVSPDGRWMAYCSTETGQNEIFVRPFPDVGEGRWTISTSGGTAPLWSPDGKELFYIDSENSAMVAVEVETEPTFKHGAPKTLFQGTYIGWPGVQYDIHPDGKRFLLIKLMAVTDDVSVQQSAGPRKINIVLNWFEELKQRVPAD
jgi:hypothetical protein